MDELNESPLKKKMRFSISSQSDVDSEDEEAVMDDLFDSSQLRDGGDGGVKNEMCVYQCHDVGHITSYMNEILGNLSVYSCLPNTVHFIFLSSMHWNLETMLEKIFDEMSLRLMYDANNITSHEDTCCSKPKETVCGVCLFNTDSLYGMECGHMVCKTCWIKYLNVQIFDMGNSVRIECPGPKCHLTLNNAIVEEFLQPSFLLTKYEHLKLNEFVGSHPKLRWCPSRGCTLIVRLLQPSNAWTNITCACGGTFCFHCGSEPHPPLKCDLLARWLKKTSDDSLEESTTWIKANTKACPKCKTPIEKNGGCNHMTCRNKSCSFEFCWICLESWKAHGDAYNCNRYRVMSDEDKNNLEGMMARLKRYHHYNDRYINHLQGLRFHSKLTNSVKAKILAFQHRPVDSVSLSDLQCLTESLDVLAESRQVLKYSYGFAFYLVASNMSSIFEDNQSDMEKATESLADYLENVIEVENDFQKVKSIVIDKSVYLKNRRDVLINHVMEGYDAQNAYPWTFRDI